MPNTGVSRALYWAKADGRNRYAVFDEERHRSDVDRFAVAARMPEAPARGEFSVEYPPLVQLCDRTGTGMEALVRWTLPDGRRLDPGRFVPLAEDSGVIVQLGRRVLAQACRHAAGWAAADPATRPYSNFASLRRLPVQALEPAGPFVTGTTGTGPGERVDLEVVGLVIAPAHTLGLTVTA